MLCFEREVKLAATATAKSLCESDSSGARPLLWAALVVALAAMGGSLFLSLLLSLGMNLKACPLCFY